MYLLGSGSPLSVPDDVCEGSALRNNDQLAGISLFQVTITLITSLTFTISQAAVDPMGVITGRAAEKITLLHYNDCFTVEPRETEPAGGAARFLTAVKEQKENNPLVLFSGNIFSPSMSKLDWSTRGPRFINCC